jgi:hypothetical protein
MKNEEAIRILDPATTREALVEIEYHAGFNGQRAVMEAVNEACVMGAEALKRLEAVVLQLEAEIESSDKYIREYDDSEVQKAYNKGLRDAAKIIKVGEHHD